MIACRLAVLRVQHPEHAHPPCCCRAAPPHTPPAHPSPLPPPHAAGVGGPRHGAPMPRLLAGWCTACAPNPTPLAPPTTTPWAPLGCAGALPPWVVMGLLPHFAGHSPPQCRQHLGGYEPLVGSHGHTSWFCNLTTLCLVRGCPLAPPLLATGEVLTPHHPFVWGPHPTPWLCHYYQVDWLWGVAPMGSLVGRPRVATP